MRLYQKIIIVVVVSLITIFGGIVNWINQFLIVGVAFFVCTFFLIDNKSKKWITLLFLLSPFLLVYGGLVLYEGMFREPLTHVYPIVFISMISAFLGAAFKLLYLKYLKKKVVIVFASLYLLLFIVGGYIFMYNWLNYVFDKKYVTPIVELSDIKIWDFSDNEIQLDEIDNKIIVLNFWSLYCGYCFKKFPDLEKIKNYYQNKDVIVYAVFIPWHYNYEEDANLENRLTWIEEQNYTFHVVKTDTLTANNLDIRGVPHIVVFNKNKEIALFGGFGNKAKRIIINNLYSVIDKALEK